VDFKPSERKVYPVALKKLAKFWEESGDGKVRCRLCPRRCVIPPGGVGFCKARRNEGGKLYSLIYGSLVSMAADPIEKKPLYHFWPGSQVFSIAAPGCNFRCLHCQNWTISQASVEEISCEETPPERVIELTERYGCKGVAHTYSEPTIWTEYAQDVGKLAHEKGLYNVYVTNGYIELDALAELSPFLDAMNVDVKSFSDEFYRRICGVPSVRPVLDTCEWAVEHGIHLEITNLLIPGENDGEEEIRALCRWAVEKLGPGVPVHFSRFYPHYKLADRPPTPVETLERAVKIAREEGLRYIYIGNVPGHEADNTRCPECGELLIERQGFIVTRYDVKDGKCPKCGAEIDIVGEYTPSRGLWL